MSDKYDGLFIKKMQMKFFSISDDNANKFDVTWKNAVKMYCPISGTPMHKIFIELQNVGMSPSDITHLEYLENPEILSKSGIKTTIVTQTTKQVLKETKKTKNWFGRTKTEEIWMEEIVDVTEKDAGYYKKKSNLILYLIAWVDILKETTVCANPDIMLCTNISDIRKMEIASVAENNFETAAICRDRINELSLKK